jgi:D-alanyl-lipoteichoic acid acyltransferase DltB (MBOAT superfamily)
MSAWLAHLGQILSYRAGDPLLFPSGLFFWLFLAFAVLHAATRKVWTVRKWLFIAFSLYFYYKCSGLFVGLLVATSVVDYWLARGIGKCPDRRVRAAFLTASLVSNLGVLFWFKYANFLGASLWGPLTGHPFVPMSIVLPVGISFYTFQSLSYTIDVWRREIEPLRDYSEFLFFVSFFPQLVAGPIVRARVFLPQIHADHYPDPSERAQAWRRIAGGLLKKAVVADYLASNLVDRVFASPLQHSGAECLMAAYGYALQIYCDFSGYSDMAIGIALLLGFRLPANFDRPYASASLTEFWRRWHISLSSWLRDYLYIPLGGNRKGSLRTYLNLAATMVLGGLWHGANWKFVLWGAMHGAGLALEKALGWPRRVERSIWLRLVGTVLTFHFAVLCWIWFRADSMASGTAMIGQILSNFRPGLLAPVLDAWPQVTFLLTLGLAVHLLPGQLRDEVETLLRKSGWVGAGLLLAAGIWAVVQTRTSAVQPFIYFQF